MSTNNEPNYRIYDRTGGGATQDIYAESLDDAIRQGREWIEDGEWSSDDGKIRKGVTLDACVRPIMRTVYYVDRYRDGQPRDIRGPYASLDDARATLTVGEEEISMDPYDGVIDGLRERHTEAEVDLVESWATEHESDADCIYSVTGQDVDGPINDEATDDQDEADCSGSYSDEEPECDEGGGEDDGGHAWVAPHELVGGCRENPGVFGGGGTSLTIIQVCTLCGCCRTELHAGSQRNPGEPESEVKYADADDATKAWMVEYHAEDGWIPQWLADRLNRTPTTRYTEETAKQYVADHMDDEDTVVKLPGNAGYLESRAHADDTEDLEHVFAALIGRRATDKDRAEGLWSHCCQAVA